VRIMKLPAYARGTSSTRLIQILCRGKCRNTSWAELNGEYPGRQQLKSGSGPTRARCLKCGYVASDYYNWGRSHLD